MPVRTRFDMITVPADRPVPTDPTIRYRPRSPAGRRYTVPAAAKGTGGRPESSGAPRPGP